MSLIKLLRKKSHNTLFTTPSHGQNLFIFSKLRQFYKYDISETDTHDPQAELKKAEKKAAEIYKTKSTHFLCNGSTSGIIAATLACKPKKVLLWESAHPCHNNAVVLSGAEKVFYSTEYREDLSIYMPATAEIIEKNLKDSGADTVIITSPTYEGFVADVVQIKKLCERFNAKLIVDEAHGALYPFSDKLPQSSVKIADFTVQSLHKTAGGLNPTALLHSNCEISPIEALKTISTTSPSYPLLASIEANINYLNSQKGKKKLDSLIENIKSLDFPEQLNDDITKILVKIEPDCIFEKFNIEDEKTNPKTTLFLCGIGTEFKNLKKLEFALNHIL